MALFNRVRTLAPLRGRGRLLPLRRQRYHLRPMRQCHADDNGCHIEIHLPSVGGFAGHGPAAQGINGLITAGGGNDGERSDEAQDNGPLTRCWHTSARHPHCTWSFMTITNHRRSTHR
jgi:hypothetical protein